MGTAELATSWSAGELVARANGLRSPRPLKRRFGDDIVSVLDSPGARADAVDTGTGLSFEGTDNSAPFQAALDYVSSENKRLLVPPGKYRFADLSGVGDSQDNMMLDGDSYTILAHGAEFLMDDQGLVEVSGGTTSAVAGGSLFSSTLTTDRAAKSKLHIVGATFRGRRNHFDLSEWDGNGGRRVLLAYGFAECILDSCLFTEIRTQAINCFSFGSARVVNCAFEKIARAGIRFNDTPDIYIAGNRFRYIGDDMIACTASLSGAGHPDGELRGRIEIIGNSGFMCQSLLIQGGRIINVIGNHLKYMMSSGIRIGSTVNQPKITPYAIVVSGNTIENTVGPEDNPGFGTIQDTADNGQITIDGVAMDDSTTDAMPGYSDGTTVIDPRGLDDNGEYIINTQDASRGPAFGIVVSNNVISQTKLPGANFSDFGEGEYFTARGFFDPAMDANKLVRHGIAFVQDTNGAIVSGNHISGHRLGAAEFYDFGNSPDQARCFRNIVSQGNIGIDNREGISTNRRQTNDPITVDIHSLGDSFDCDPYLKNAERNGVDGTWQVGTAAADMVAAINARGTTGWVVRNLVAANCVDAIHTNGGDPHVQCDISGCVVVCDPAFTGFSSSNKGVATVPPAGKGFTHKIVHCDATDAANFGLLKNICPAEAAAQPSSGTFVEGHIVRNTDATSIITGWQRLTTGSAHVAGVDWVALFRPRGAASVTASELGAGTGVIPDWATHVIVTSAGAGRKVTLPSGAAENVGRPPLLIWVGATGFELIGDASSPPPTINNVDSGDGVAQADIGANTLSRLTLVAADTWLLENLSNLGAVNTAIVPDDD